MRISAGHLAIVNGRYRRKALSDREAVQVRFPPSCANPDGAAEGPEWGKKSSSHRVG